MCFFLWLWLLLPWVVCMSNALYGAFTLDNCNAGLQLPVQPIYNPLDVDLRVQHIKSDLRKFVLKTWTLRLEVWRSLPAELHHPCDGSIRNNGSKNILTLPFSCQFGFNILNSHISLFTILSKNRVPENPTTSHSAVWTWYIVLSYFLLQKTILENPTPEFFWHFGSSLCVNQQFTFILQNMFLENETYDSFFYFSWPFHYRTRFQEAQHKSFPAILVPVHSMVPMCHCFRGLYCHHHLVWLQVRN